MTLISISEVEIIPKKTDSGVLAFVDFTVNGSIRAKSVAIFSDPEGGYRLSYPSKKIDGKNIHYFKPISEEAAKTIKNEIIKEFLNVIGKPGR